MTLQSPESIPVNSSFLLDNLLCPIIFIYYFDYITDDSASKPIDISRLNLKIGHIVSVKKHPDADSLYIEEGTAIDDM